MARRYSTMAVFSVVLLVLAGLCLAWFYVGTWNGLYGTSYGVLLMAKIYLLLVMLLMGVGNWLMVQRLDTDPQPLLSNFGDSAKPRLGWDSPLFWPRRRCPPNRRLLTSPTKFRGR